MHSIVTDAQSKSNASTAWDFSLWWSWTISCGIGETIGMAMAATCAVGLTFVFSEPATNGARLVVLAVMLFAGLVEGVAIGWFQWRVLRRVFPSVTWKEWLTPTVSIALAGWFLGMLPVTIASPKFGEEATTEPSMLLFVCVAATFGVVAGVAFGWAQWFALRRWVTGAQIWIAANALGWAVAMTIIFLGASIPTESTPHWLVAIIGTLTGACAGLSIGGISGLGLVALAKKRAATE